MRMPVRKLVAGLGLVLAVSVLTTVQPASAATINVAPGQSIQAAIDAASPGDTVFVQPGTYYESLTIGKDRIRLLGNGATLLPPYGGADNGIFVVGDFTGDPQSGPITVNHRVTGVSISSFTIRGFNEMGVFVLVAKDTSVSNTTATDNGEYGYFANTSTGTKFTGDTATGSGEAGFYVGDSPAASATITTSNAADNGFGFFVRNAQGVTISSSDAHGNCVGLLILADAPGPAGNVTVKSNHLNANNRACPASDDGPPLSGIGILDVGGHDNTFSGNTIQGNVPAGPSIASGGVVLVTDPSVQSVQAATAPVNNVFRGNVIKNNQPQDVLYDGSGYGNSFGSSNVCPVTSPPNLCGT